MTCSIARWLRAAFLPTWWADLPDWRCFWPPLEFTAFLLLSSANDRPRSVSPWPWARGWATFFKCSFANGLRLPACTTFPSSPFPPPHLLLSHTHSTYF